MNIFRKIVFILNFLLLLWVFVGTLPEFNITGTQNRAYLREQISEIDNSKSVEDLKKIAKSKIFSIQRIHQIDDEKRENFSYIIFLIITSQLLLYINFGKKGEKQ